MKFTFKGTQHKAVKFSEIPVGAFFVYAGEDTDDFVQEGWFPYLKVSDELAFYPGTNKCYPYPTYFNSGIYQVLKVTEPISVDLV